MTTKDKELIRLYGEFLVGFEFIFSKIRFSILYLLYPNYDAIQKNLCEIMTEGLTADQLRKKFIALIIERFTKKSDVYKSVQCINKLLPDLIELRNSFAHGTLFVGEHDFIHETKRGHLAVRHPKLKSEGLDLNFKSFNRKLLKSLIESIHKIRNAALKMTIIIKLEKVNANATRKFHDAIQNDLAPINIKLLLNQTIIKK
ncbi:MAG TPA: hypothetical protein VK498_10970 [Ferruginibacter sp.]|nr:hypothetical protein [Ferruginibacter sp.]